MQTVEIREAIRQAIDEEMARDDSVFLIGEEVAEYNGAYKVSKGLLDKWGDRRIIDTPISETGFAGIAIGAALTGLRPIVEFMSFNFSFVAADQIINHACPMYYMSNERYSVPIVFRGPNGAAAKVSCQHSRAVEAFYSQAPGCKIVVPSNAYDAKGLLKSAIRDDNPVFFLENELMYGIKEEIPVDEFLVPIGKAKIVQEGRDLTLISHGRMILLCKEAVVYMAKKGIKIELVDLRTIIPLDIGTIINSIRKTHRAVLVEEGHGFGGICAEIGMTIMEHAFDELDAPLKRVYQMTTPLPYSGPLEQESIPNTKRIIRAIEEVMQGE